MDNEILYELQSIIENEIKQTKDVLFEKENYLKKITLLIQKNCEHEIITDYIDLLNGYRESVMIKYCKKCEKTF